MILASSLKSVAILFARSKSVVMLFLLYHWGMHDDQCVGVLVSFLYTSFMSLPTRISELQLDGTQEKLVLCFH